MPFTGITSSVCSHSQFNNVIGGTQHPAYLSMSGEWGDNLKNTKGGVTSSYIRELEDCGVMKIGSPILFQTDSLFFFPVFNNAEINKVAVFSPSKIQDVNADTDSITRGSDYQSLDFIDQAGIYHEQKKVYIESPAFLSGNTVEYNPNLTTTDSILDYSGFFISFYLASPDVAGTYFSVNKGGSVLLEVAPTTQTNQTAFSSSAVKVNSTFIQSSLNTVVPNQGPGIYLFGIHKVPARARKNSTTNFQPTTSAKSDGYKLEIKGYFLADLESELVELFSIAREIDPKFGYELEYLYSNLENIEFKKDALSSVNPKRSKAELLNSLNSAGIRTGSSSAISSYAGRKASNPAILSGTEIQNFYKGNSRITLNKYVVNKFQTIYNNTPLIRNGTRASSTELDADRVLKSFKLTEDVYETVNLNTVQIQNGINFGLLSNQISQNCSLIFPGQGVTNNYSFSALCNGTYYSNKAYRFFGAGTGINTKENSEKFMRATLQFIDNLG